jgi:hypothetical protein
MAFSKKRLVFTLLAGVCLAHGSSARHLLQYDKANLKSDLEKLNINVGDVNCPEVGILTWFTVTLMLFD